MSQNTTKHLSYLGCKGKDKITGFEGVVDSVCFDLYGCIQVSLKPPMTKEGKVENGYWFDINRIVLESKKPVMKAPNFDEGYQAEGRQGSADKPSSRA